MAGDQIVDFEPVLDQSDPFFEGSAAAGRILWRFHTGQMVSNGPSTYLLNGEQYLVAAAGDTLFAFRIVDRKLK